MFEKLKISHHKYSGRLLAHEFTSYLPLAIMVLIVGVILTFFTFSDVALGSTPYSGPEAGSIGLTGVVPAKPPTVGGTIAAPTNNQHFRSSPITVSGACPTHTLVEIYKNKIFAGSTPCNNGNFSISIDLLFGQNILTAQVYDVLNQAGPVSSPVTVFYDFAPPQTDPLSLINLEGAQLLLNTDAVYRGTFPGQNLNVPVTIIGGTPPYALNVQWGDSNNKVIPRSNNLTFNASHAYQKAGTFGITLQATDSKQLTAFLTVAAIVNGQPSVVASTNNLKASVNKLLMLWPLYTIAATMVVSFWLGERREKKIINHKIEASKPLLGPPGSQTKPPL